MIIFQKQFWFRTQINVSESPQQLANQTQCCGQQRQGTTQYPTRITWYLVFGLIVTTCLSTHSGLLITEIWVNIGLGIALMPDNTKPLSKPMFTYHSQGSVSFT